MKVAIIGGGGVRTPLLIYGLAEARERLGVSEIALHDVDRSRAECMAVLGREIAGPAIAVAAVDPIERAIEGADFVVSSVRVGGIAARARDERIAIEHGLAGQETTGPGGLAMALRTVPVALAHARMMEQYAPGAHLLSLTNPAGLITEAVLSHTSVRAIGICDTPSELFHRIGTVLDEDGLDFGYSGLNHLGWVSSVERGGEELLPRLLEDDTALASLYPARLFEPEMIRALGLIPSEYLFFVYARGIAWRNQKAAGASRGEELQRLNANLFSGLTLESYKEYLNRRNASYLKLEAVAESAKSHGGEGADPFAAATGYHRIAVDVMTALMGDQAKKIVVNVRNGDTIPDLPEDAVVEAPCKIDRRGAHSLPAGPLPATVRGLVQAVKEYERLAIRAACTGSIEAAKLALLVYPVVGEWAPAAKVVDALVAADPDHLGYLM